MARFAKRAVKTFSLDREILSTIKRTKGSQSESERVNTLLHHALELERRAALAEEAAGFYSSARVDRREGRPFEEAGISSWTRE